jgi:iron complex outermembrane receptor protein
MSRRAWRITPLLCLIAFPLAAQEAQQAKDTAREAPAKTQPAPASGGIEEIIVTAEKREMSVQDTPVAITALGSETIEQGQLYSPDRLQWSVPSMTYGQQSSYNFITLRGIGGDVTVSAEASVASYEDGIYTGSLLSQQVPGFDLERIEVLRGPQGTLYGRNADGGVINYITKPPSFEPEANLAVSYGKYNAVQVDAGATGALIEDKLAGRLSVRYTRHDGYRRNIVSGDDEYDLRNVAVRGALEFTPSEDFTLTVRGAYADNVTSAGYTVLSATPTGLPGADPLTNVTGGPYGTAPLGIFSMPAQFFLDVPIFMSPADVAALGGGSIADYYGLTAAGPVPPDPEKSLKFSNAAPSEYDVTLHNFSATLDWDAGPFAFKSITAYRYGKLTFSQDSLGAGNPGVVFFPLTHATRQFTQEFNVSGTAFDEKLDWLAGVFYFRDDAHFNTSVWIPTSGDALLAACGTTAGLGFLNATLGCTTSTGAFPFALIPTSAFPYDIYQRFPSDPLTQITKNSRRVLPSARVGQVSVGDVPETAFLGFDTEQLSWSTAGFFQFTYHLLESLRVTAGVRYTFDSKEVTRSLHSNLIETLIRTGLASPVAPDGVTPTLCNQQKDAATWDAFTGTVGVDYDLLEDTLVYAKYSRGYKGGGWNPGECGKEYDPEGLSDYETGIKSTFLDAQVRTNAAFYYYDYQDIQFTLYVPNQSFIRNAGTAKAYGLELEYILRPDLIEGVQLDGSASWEHSEYGSGLFQDVAGIIKAPPLGPGIQIKGNQLIRAPEWKAFLGAQYTFETGTAGSFTTRIEGAYTSTYYNDIFNGKAPGGAAATQPGFWLGNARVIWDSSDTKYQAMFFIDNFTEKLYAENRVTFNTPSALSMVDGQFAAPRTYGFRVSTKFGGK